MREKGERTYTWFIEPLNEHTNRSLARELPEEDAIVGAYDEHGHARNVYRAEWEKIAIFKNSGVGSGLKFRIYVKEGDGKMRSAALLFRKRAGSKSLLANHGRKKAA